VPLHFAAKLPDACLRLGSHKQPKSRFHDGPFGARAGTAHCLLYQLVIDFDIRPHRAPDV